MANIWPSASEYSSIGLCWYDKNAAGEFAAQSNGLVAIHANQARGGIRPHGANLGPRPQSQPFDIPQRGGTPVGDAADHGGQTGRPVGKRNFVTENPRLIFRRDQMAVRINVR